MKLNWKEICKFLSGAFFVNAGVLAYLTWNNVTVPFFGLSVPIIQSPEFLGPRSIIHFGLFILTFYFGFIKK